jgi:hypothetical protein
MKTLTKRLKAPKSLLRSNAGTRLVERASKAVGVVEQAASRAQRGAAKVKASLERLTAAPAALPQQPEAPRWPAEPRRKLPAQIPIKGSKRKAIPAPVARRAIAKSGKVKAKRGQKHT